MARPQPSSAWKKTLLAVEIVTLSGPAKIICIGAAAHAPFSGMHISNFRDMFSKSVKSTMSLSFTPSPEKPPFQSPAQYSNEKLPSFHAPSALMSTSPRRRYFPESDVSSSCIFCACHPWLPRTTFVTGLGVSKSKSMPRWSWNWKLLRVVPYFVFTLMNPAGASSGTVKRISVMVMLLIYSRGRT